MKSIVIEMEGGVLRCVSTYDDFVKSDSNALSESWKNKHTWEEHKTYSIYLVDYDQEEHNPETCDECIVARENGDMDTTGYKEERNGE